MTTIQLIGLAIGASGFVPTFAARLRLPPPIALLVVGILVGLVPGVPQLQLDPSVVIFLILPPIVYAATLRQSLRRLAGIAWWAVAPAVGLIVAPMVAVALAAHAVIHDLAWSSAVVLVPPVAAGGVPFPDRDLILVFTAALVLTSMLLQGTTVGALVRRIGLSGDEGRRREEQVARGLVAQAGREQLRASSDPDHRLDVFAAQRAALVHLYDTDEIGDETLLELRQEIDVEAQYRSLEGMHDFAIERLERSP